MAKTINEMAEEHYPFRWPGGNLTWADERRTEGFIDGANAVLEEVEKAIDLGKYPDLISPTEALFKVTQLVIRLKG